MGSTRRQFAAPDTVLHGYTSLPYVVGLLGGWLATLHPHVHTHIIQGTRVSKVAITSGSSDAEFLYLTHPSLEQAAPKLLCSPAEAASVFEIAVEPSRITPGGHCTVRWRAPHETTGDVIAISPSDDLGCIVAQIAVPGVPEGTLEVRLTRM